jgi:hypothetical protein
MMTAIEVRGGDFMKGNGAFHAGEARMAGPKLAFIAKAHRG